MALTLGIKLLGGFLLTYGDRPLAGALSTRSQALLTYLLLHRSTSQPRQRIAFHLWADSTDSQARTNLRKELSYLRRDLPDADEFLLIDAKTLQWSSTAPFTLDVLGFEAVVKQAEQTQDTAQARTRLEAAIAHYTGDLLPGWEDAWIVTARERLRQMYGRVLEQLTQVLKAQQDYRAAIAQAQQWMRLDPLNEVSYAVLMELHGLSGDRATALQVYHRCMTLAGSNPHSQ